MKNGKSPDREGIMTEHLKFGGAHIAILAKTIWHNH